jgi:hypothetical protein
MDLKMHNCTIQIADSTSCNDQQPARKITINNPKSAIHTAAKSDQFLSQPEVAQQRLITLFARLCSSYDNPPYAPHHMTVIHKFLG